MPKVVYFTRQDEEVAGWTTRHAPSSFDVEVHPISLSDDEKILLVRDADFLILFPSVISEDVLAAAKNVKLIQLVGAGFDRLDLGMCARHGVPVANNGGTNSTDVAEHALAMILAFYRQIPMLDRAMREDPMAAEELETGRFTYAIEGKKAGVVGFGNIGRKTGRLLRAFGAEVLYSDAIRLPEYREQQLGARGVALDDLLEQSDIVTLHVPLNDSTRGMIGARELALMKPSVLLVNTCRGGVVDESALIEALRAKRIKGAALDVLEQEPTSSDNPLLKMDNVILTPHSAGITVDTWDQRGRFIFGNIQRVWEGNEPLAAVTPTR